jgi:sortase A
VTRVLTFVGKLLISLGVGVLMFVAWTLWGTGFFTARSQAALERRFDTLPDVAVQSDIRPDGTTYKGPSRSFKPGPGDPVFKLRLPDIPDDDKSFVVVQGVGIEQLKLGPGHYPSCRDGFSKPLCTELPEVWPGERGRVIVSGHRTTYDAPFWSLDKLRKGDEIITQTKWGTFTYNVSHSEVVPPDSTDIANPAAATNAEIVLTTCNPRFSAAERLVVYGVMEAL